MTDSGNPKPNRAAPPKSGARPAAPLDPVAIIARAALGPFAPPNAAIPTDPVAIIANALAPAAWRTAAAPAPAAAPAEPAQAAAMTSADGQAAFWQLWTEHQAYLRKHSLRLMAGNMADAEDALSNAMLKAMQKFGVYAGSIVNERAWLTRLVHNVCMDLHRSNQRIARSLDETVGDDLGTLGSTLEGDGPTPEDDLLSRRSIGELSAQLDRMPASLRTPLLMRVLDEMSYDDIAAQLNLSNCAVRKRIQLAREFLRKSGIRE